MKKFRTEREAFAGAKPMTLDEVMDHAEKHNLIDPETHTFVPDLPVPEGAHEEEPHGYTVGGYTIDAYCVNHAKPPRYCESNQGIGQTEREALRDLKRQGWVIVRKKGQPESVTCPRCARPKR